MTACNKDTLSISDPLFDNIQSENLIDINDNISESQGLLNGTQRINVNQTDSRLIRGTEVRIPFFADERETVNVPTGSWITISFSFRDEVYDGPCEGPLTEAQVTSIIEDAAATVEQPGIEVSFDGEGIDVINSFRGDEITLVNNTEGDCRYILPFRYYVNPQSKGEHTLSCVVAGVTYSRTVNWVAGEKKGI